ncbi:GMC family oxidoreductase N-terminal domain-containing protein [Rubripirellula reticaptiva]|uniref:Cholesterol oxidase n=1 Tax=Rubripirellula reticaptiva TaxID=2528013 RepID=A0A5C6F747_9BACT|nr:GMC family oxidoreductase [Rubripirellula reticaptiva]TWU56257.1 Cholesterol oxidase [Rubripirellula reticaptiva]
MPWTIRLCRPAGIGKTEGIAASVTIDTTVHRGHHANAIVTLDAEVSAARPPIPVSMETRRNVLKSTAALVASAASSIASPRASADFALVRSLPVIVDRARTGSSEFKERAIADHAANMKPFGGSLARHGHALFHQTRSAATGPWDFDIVVIGSGYGASICAARLAMAKQSGVRLAVLERGREWIPGTFADTFAGAMKQSRYQMLGPNKKTIDNPIGLFNAMQNDEVNVLSGNGLGGSSLINANVAIRPDADCFNQTDWPAALRDRRVLDPYYDRASLELDARVESIDASPKMRSQRLAAKRLEICGANFEPASLTVTRGSKNETAAILNRQGLRQRGCIDCGDCTAGCNVGAKNTLAMNYLPLARRHGAEIYTHTEVVRIEKLCDHYRIHFNNFHPDREGKLCTQSGTTTTRMVVVGAGSIGSNEILLRSRSAGLSVSDRVGHRWTTNGDAVGFIRKSDHLTNIGGFSAFAQSGCAVGPTIQTNLTYPGRTRLSERVLIQDGSVSRSYANVLGLLMQDMDLDQTLVMLGMGHDGAAGRVVLGDDGLGSVKWPGLKDSPYRKLIRREFAKVAAAHGGKYKYLKIFGDNLITVHPLGGCAMADDPRNGVVDDCGRVFDASRGGQWDAATGLETPSIHTGLYVADGSIIPTSIGCNPLMTISALAERISQQIAGDPAHADLFA